MLRIGIVSYDNDPHAHAVRFELQKRAGVEVKLFAVDSLNELSARDNADNARSMSPS